MLRAPLTRTLRRYTVEVGGVTDAVLPAVQTHIDVLDRAVAATGHLAGESFTLADISLLPILHYVQLCPEGADMVRSAGDLSAYFAHHAQRPGYKASFPPPLPTGPVRT